MPAKPRILILGAAGQVGSELRRSFHGAGEMLAVGPDTLDLTQLDELRDFVRAVRPELILNAAAYTAVDRAESEPALAMAVNASAPRVLAEEAVRLNALLVHYSTDYVFDGQKPDPWTELDPPHPLNAYGASKLAGEQAIQEVGGRYLIFRTSWIYGPHGHNFLLTMLRLARERDRLSIVDDQHGSPTTSTELAHATHKIVAAILAGQHGPSHQWAGLYHMTCADSATWFGFAQAIFARATKLLDAKVPELIPVATADYPSPAKRPLNSVLSNAKLHWRFAVGLSPWPAALDAAIQTLGTPKK